MEIEQKFWKRQHFYESESEFPAPPRGRIFQNFRIALKLLDMINSIKMIKKTIFFAHRWACSVLRGHNEQNRGKKHCWKKFRFTFVEVLSFPEFLFDFHEILHTYFKLVVFHHVQTAKQSDEYFKSYSTSNRGPIFFGTDCMFYNELSR